MILAIDQGTTGTTCLVVNEQMQATGRGYCRIRQYFPNPGWVEHDPEEIWASVVAASEAALAAAHITPAELSAIGIANQRETTLVWERRTGRPLQRAIVWQDRRTAERCRELPAELIRERTGVLPDPYFSATKLEWILARTAASPNDLAFGTVDSWLLWKLTAGAGKPVHATDPSNASRTLLYDIGGRAWSAELCELFGVPMACLPEVRPSSGAFGTTEDGIAVSGIAGDQQAALFGQACFEPGMAKNTYGTGSFVLMNVGDRHPEPVEGLLTTIGWELADGTMAYVLEGAIFVTGAAVQWLRDGLGLIHEAADVEALAASVNSTEGVYLVPAFTGLGSPWWDPYARGTIVGLTRGTGRAHLARAVLESMAYQTRDVVEAMSAAAGRDLAGLRADGGGSANDLLLQLQADQLQAPVRRPAVQETTALGAAYLAGLAAGVWSTLDEVARHWKLDAEFTPAVPASVADARHADWRRAVDRSRGWVA